MRNMSFSLTTKQIQDKTKFVTRRLGWRFLKPGDLVRPVVKGMGLKKGEKVEPIRGPLRIVCATRQPLFKVYNEPHACGREGFPEMLPTEFVEMFCNHMRANPETMITRIEFEYTD